MSKEIIAKTQKEIGDYKRENLFMRLLNWIARGAKKTSEILASCSS